MAQNKDFRVKNGLVVEEGAIISGLSYPTVDGSADYVIATDGSGNLTLQPAKATASNVSYDNTESGLIASNVQSAIDELQVNKADVSLLSSNITLFPTTAASDIATYVVMVTSTSDANYNVTAVDIPTGEITTTDQLIASLATAPDLIEGSIEGVNITTVGNIEKTAGNSNQGASFHFEVYRREAGGTEHLIGTSNETSVIYETDGYQQFFASALIYNSGAIFAATDRIVIKYYATNHGGGSPEFQFQFGGAAPVKTLVPVPVEVVIHENNAEDILVDTANFANILSVADDDIQTALETIDSMSIGDISDVDLSTPATTGQALVWNGTHFAPADSGGGGGGTFVSLTDTPSSFTGHAGKTVVVNSNEDGVEFGDLGIGSQSRDLFTSTVGQTVFTLTNTYGGQNSILVFVNGVPQWPGENFTISGQTLTFTSAPDTDSQILVYGLSPLTNEITPGDGTVTAKKLAASAYTRDIFTGNGVLDTFNLSGDVGTIYAPFVFVGGILQDPVTHYNVNVSTNPQTITFTEAIPDQTEVTVVYGPVSVTGVPSDASITFSKLAPSNFNYTVYTGNGVQTNFTMSQAIVLPQQIIVTVAGIPQAPDGDSYTVSNTTLIFSEAPPSGAKIVIRYYGSPLPIGTPSDNTVSTVTIQDDAVTPDKLDRVYATPTDVTNAINGLIDTAPEALNTLNELAAALNDDENFATTITNRITEAETLAVSMAIALG